MSDARVYVGTYGKYNNASIDGDWVDLDAYAGDKEGFLEKCREIHSDEEDPEFMYQDYEGFPKCYYSESGLPESLFEWLELSEEDQKMVDMYAEATGYDHDEIDIRDAKDKFIGIYDSAEDYAEQWRDDGGHLKDLPPIIESAIDFERIARDLMYDLSTAKDDENNLWVFSNS